MTFRKLFVFGLTLLHFGPTGVAQEVDRERPAIFESQLEVLLTPLDEVLENAESEFLDDESGAILIEERIDFVADDGKFYRLLRQVNRANTQAGTEALEKETFSFSTSESRITLIEARTIQPDGTMDAVRKNAALIQDKGDAGNGTYQDQSELILIFPNVKPKSLTETIVLITRDGGYRVPDEYMTTTSWSRNIWPQVERKLIVDLPNPLANRVSVKRLGAGVPEVTKEASDRDRTRFVWTAKNLPRREYVRNAAPGRQTGPATLVTTWKSWDDLALWYSGLLEGRGDLPDDLRAQLEKWTKGLSSEDEIIEALYSKVANDVRYVGLEFGLSGLQPYPCGEVWENGYGDCKDKSNLLRTLLVAKGIEAHLALVDTDHGGNVEMRSPNYQPFNHAILAVKDAKSETGWRLLDPTISRAPAGTIGQWVADRDVLILNGESAIWTRSPKSTAGEIDYEFTLDIESSGSLSGWLEMRSKGYLASSMADDYANRGRDTALRSAQNLVDDFFPRAEVIDLEHDKIKASHEEFTLRAYFVSPHPFPQNEDDPVQFLFPETGAVLPYLGEKSRRNAGWFMWKDLTRVHLDIGMPDGWKVGRMPKPISIDGDAIAAKASWKADKTGQRLKGYLEVIQKQSTIAGSQFASAFNTVNSISNWLKGPAQFAPGNGKGGSKSADKGQSMTVKLPIMPTGEGQLDLVNARYPVSAGVSDRRTALRQTLQYFPNDAETQFSARSKIAYLEYYEDNYAEAVKMLDSALADLGQKASTDIQGWARFIRCLALLEMEDRRKEGIEGLVTLSKNQKVDDYRRCWSAYNAAKILKEDSPERAVEVIKPVLKAEDEDATPALYGLYASIMVELGRSDELLAQLETILREGHPLASQIFSQLANVAKTAIYEATDDDKPAPEKPTKFLHEVIASLDLATLTEADPDLGEAMSELNSSVDSQKLLGGLRKEIIAIVNADDAPDYLRSGVAPKGLDTVEAFEAQLEELRENGDYPQYLTTLCAYFEKFPPSEKFPFFVWKLLAYSEYYERPVVGEDPPTPDEDKNFLFPKVLEVANKLPSTDDNYLECKFTEGRWLERRHRYAQAAKLYEMMLKHPNFNNEFSVSATTRAGKAWEKVGNFRKAEASYLRSKHEANDVAAAVDGLFRAALIRLETGREDEALELFDEIRQLNPDTVSNAAFADMVNSFLELTKEPAKAKAYWEHTASWWPIWREICHSLPGIDEKMTQRKVIGLIGDVDLHRNSFSQGVADKDGAQFLQAYEVAAHGARWDPDMMAELARLTIYGAARLNPDDAKEFHEFVTSAYSKATPIDESSIASFYLFRIVALGDDHPVEASKVAKEYFEAHPDDHDSTEAAMARVWAISSASSGDEVAMGEAAATLDSQLQSATPVSERVLTITTLADLYRKTGNAEAEAALLKRELKHPTVRSDEGVRRDLNTRLAALADATQEGGRLTVAVRSWIDSNNLRWLDACEPLTLKDRRLKNLEETADQGSNALDDFGNVKMWLLAAEKSDLSLDARWSAFLNALSTLVNLAPNRDRKFELYSTALELDLPDRLLNYFVYYGTAFYSDLPNKDHYLFFRNHPAGENLWDKADARLVVFDALADASESDPDAQLAAVEKITSADISSVGLGAIRSFHRELLEFCFYDAAEEVLNSISDWTLDNSVDQTALTLKLEFLKTQKQATEIRTRNETLRKLVSEKIGFEALEKGDAAAYLYDVDELPSSILLNDIHVVLLQAVRDGRVGTWRASEWFEIFDPLPYTPEIMDLRFEMLSTYLTETANDLERSVAILSLSSLIDTDDAGNRDRVEKEILAEWESRRTEAPLTWDAIRNYRTKISIRTGDQSINPEKELADFDHPFLQSSKVSTVLKFALAREDKALIDRIVEKLSVEELVSDYMLGLTLPALELLGRDAELELVREEAMIVRNRSAIEAWATGDMAAASNTVALANLLHDRESLPDGWFEGTLSQLKQERHRLGLLAAEAMLREDWKAATQFSADAVEKFPTYYHFYGLLGRSAFKMGDFDKAREPLKTFIKYANDSILHKEVKTMLEQIEQK